MSSIKGEKTSRDPPATKRILRYNECNQDSGAIKLSVKEDLLLSER